MKSDSYSRYLRSELYKDFLNVSKKKVRHTPPAHRTRFLQLMSFPSFASNLTFIAFIFRPPSKGSDRLSRSQLAKTRRRCKRRRRQRQRRGGNSHIYTLLATRVRSFTHDEREGRKRHIWIEHENDSHISLFF